MFESPNLKPAQEHAPSPFESWLASEFPKQYEQRARTLDRLGLLRILPESGMYGIVDKKGRERPFPEMEDVKKKLLENREFFEKKVAQGFTRLSIAPILPKRRLFDVMRKTMLKKKQEGKLFSTNGEPLDLDENDPLYVWEGYENQEIAYFPEAFDRTNHGGMTIDELLDDPGQAFPGFLVSFLEEDLDIPREGQGKTKNGRKRIETNKTPIEYLELLRENETYQGESGLTIEEWATLFLTNLEEENQVIDDYENKKSSVSWNLGTYFPAGSVSYANWSRDYRRTYVNGYGARNRLENFGVRSAVRV